MKKENAARIYVVTSMAIFGTIGVLVRNIALPSGEIAFFRALLATLLIGGFLLVTKRRITLHGVGRELVLLVLSGVAIGFNWILLFEAYGYTTVSVATLSYYFAPVIVTVISPLLFREKMTGRGVICFLASTVGIVLITGLGNLAEGSSHLVGIIYGLGAASLYATVILLNKSIKSIGGIERTFLQFLAALPVMAVYVLIDGGFRIASLSSDGWIYLLIVGILHTGVTYCLYFTAIPHLSGGECALLSYVDPLVAVILSVTLLGEGMSWQQLLGGALILGFTLWNELPPIGKRKRKTGLDN